ncbi:hypothetical protein [Cellulomonas citrea]|uniref:hypothetical protein n=1 Tax=Cellulomonas citrea TaxID=1909423 RepID=UPI001359CF88|nr:hypothetical protein [Cellulomonas citrea]
MDWREFVATLLGHVLSWPVVVLVLFLLFRKPVGELIQRVKRVEVAGQVVDFDQSLGRATELSAASVALAEDEKGKTGPEPGHSARPEIEPTASVLMSWERLAANIRHLHESAGLEARPHSSVIRLAGSLAGAGIVNDTFVAAVRELYFLRNAVAHGEHLPDAEEAKQYASAAEELARAAELFAGRQVRPAPRRAVRTKRPAPPPEPAESRPDA